MRRTETKARTEGEGTTSREQRHAGREPKARDERREKQQRQTTEARAERVTRGVRSVARRHTVLLPLLLSLSLNLPREKTRQDKTRRDKTDKTRQDKTRQDRTDERREDKTRQDKKDGPITQDTQQGGKTQQVLPYRGFPPRSQTRRSDDRGTRNTHTECRQQRIISCDKRETRQGGKKRKALLLPF